MNLKVNQIIQAIERYAPPAYQESYDNAGLIVGDRNQEINSVLLSLDVTEEIVAEAVEQGAGMIVAHHPVIFKGLKRLTPDNYVQRTVISAIKHNIAIYAAHTNLDAVYNGVNMELAKVLDLKNIQVLQPVSGKLKKLYCFVPVTHAETLRDILFSTGAGEIGNYDSCSFNTEGYGTFRAGEGTHPFVGEQGKLHKEKEVKIEVVFPEHLQIKIISALRKAHPYEEPAFDIIPLDNNWEQLGIGMIGELQNAMNPEKFLSFVKEKLGTPCLKYTGLPGMKSGKWLFAGEPVHF